MAAPEKEIAEMAAPEEAVTAPDEEIATVAAPAASVAAPAASAGAPEEEIAAVVAALQHANIAEITEMVATVAAPAALAAAPEEEITEMATTAVVVAALEEEISSLREEEIAAPEEEITAVVAAVPYANIADTVYENGCFMFKNVGAINDIDNLSTADMQKFKRAIATTETKEFKRSNKTSRTTIDLETSGIHGVRVYKQKEQFLVHWTDGGFKSWEPTENVSNLIGVMNYLSNTKKNATIHIE
jgi:hypothetical protein